ncbi:MAG: hypothetical protein IRZ16_22850 [Myxococcaceae bacterium]|nr:hypothetical protein [Myxococcaceae bacterium]
MFRILPLAALAICALPRFAEAAAQVRLGLGADYHVYPRRGLLNLTLAVDGPIARHLRVGGRFGALATSSPTEFGAPLDFDLRAHLAGGRVYLEGLVGPWLMFGGGDFLRLHAALGFGLQTSGLTFGLEVGYLDPGPIAGLRLGFRI